MKRLYAISTAAMLLVATAALAQDAKLGFKFPAGSYVTQSSTKLSQAITIMGMNLPTSGEVTTAYRTTIGAPDAEGKVRVEQKPEAVRAKLDIAGAGVVEYDSAKPDANKPGSEQVLAVWNTFKAMGYLSRTIVLDKDGKVVGIEGIQKAIDAAPGDIQETVKREMDSDKLKLEAIQDFGLLPDQSVKKGDRWTRTQVQNIGGGRVFTVENFYEYQGTVEKGGRTYDKIGVFINSAKFTKAATADDPTVIAANDLKVDSSSGTILFDRELGRIVDNSSMLHVSGPMTITVMGMDLTAKFEMTMDTSEVVK